MEIFSYSENTLSTGRMVSSGNFRRVLLKSLRGNSRTRTAAIPLTQRQFTAPFDAKILLASVKRVLKCLKNYLWLIPAVVIVILIPFTVVNAIDYIESSASLVKFDTENTITDEMLLGDLTNFALSTEAYYAAYENEADDLPAAVSFKEPVVFQNYKVRSGDTIDSIGRKFGLRNFSTLITVNNISNVRVLRAGQVLRIPSMDGMIHTVSKGESINSIAAKYGITLSDLIDVNDIDSEVISAGQELFIPGAGLDKLTLLKAMGELFLNPIKVKYRFTSPFAMRNNPVTGVYSHHTGVDFACPTGTPIYSALSGTVVFTGTSNVYGHYVIVKHHDGYQTLYAHMSKILAKKGQYVDQNTKLGLVGSTGQSTGPHLHFSVYKNGKLIDPMTVIKK